MKKRKVTSLACQQVDQKVNVGSETQGLVESSFSCDTNPTENKVPNGLASIAHKNSCGAKNWKTFLNNKKPRKKLCLKKDEGTNATENNLKKSTRSSFESKPNDNLLNDSVSEEKSSKSSEQSVKGGKINKNDKPLGSINNGIKPKKKKQNTTTGKKKKPLTKQIAMDCEMVGVEIGVKNSILARVSLVNANGDCVYDKYVMPTEPVLDYRTQVSGIRPKDLENAPDFKTVQQEVADIIKGRILVGHSLKHDLGVLFLSHPVHKIRDTAKFKKFKVGKTPGLKYLAKKYLGVNIQDGEHSSVQDALAAMQLYKMFKKEWESSFKKRESLTQKIRNISLSSSTAATDV